MFNLLGKVKNVIPASFFPYLRELRFRFEDNKSENLINKEAAEVSNSWKKILTASEDVVLNENHLKLMFVTGYGVGTSYLTIEPIIMMNMKARGHKIYSMYCNKSLPSCEYNVVGNNSPSAKHFRRGITKKSIEYTCNKCVKNLTGNYKNLDITLIPYSEYLDESDYEKASRIAEEQTYETFKDYMFEGISVGEEIYSSILRATFKGKVDRTEDNIFLIKRFAMSGVLSVIALERAFKDIKPDRVVMIHGIYQTHGLPSKVAKKLNIPVVVMGGGGIRKDTVVMCHEKTYHHQLVNESNSLWENYELTDLEKNKTLTYAKDKRRSGSGVDYLNFHPNPLENKKAILNELKIKDKTREIVTIYTNVVWDAQIFYNGNAFENIFEWMKFSIEKFAKNKNVNLIIRIHPAEVKSANPSLQPMKAEIEKNFPNLPENVYIVGPESDICSYSLAELSRVCVIYGTKMGLELALMKKPLVICGETFSRYKGYGLDISSEKDYSKFIDNAHIYDADVDEAFERALKYAHYFYFRRMLDLPYTSGIGTKELNFKNIQELLNFPSLDTIAEGIEDLKPFELKNKNLSKHLSNNSQITN